MKSERRHELATNELADWVVHFPQWFRENQTTIIATAIVVVGLGVYTFFFYSRQSRAEKQKKTMAAEVLDQLSWQREAISRGEVQGRDISNVFLGAAGKLGVFAENAENPVLSALATIKGAEALRSELHYRAGIEDADARREQFEQIVEIYREALEKAKGRPAIAAMAEYGMALSFEDMQNFAEAETLYNKIASTAEYQGTSFPSRAKLRLKTLEDKKREVFFVRAEPQQAPDIQRPGPFTLDAPLTLEEAAAQKDLDFNSNR